MVTAQARVEPGVYLQVRWDAEQFAILHAARLPRAPRVRLHAPLLTPGTAPVVRTAAAEVTLAVLAANGEVLDSFGWPAKPESFFDREDKDGEGGLRGTPGAPSPALRVLRVPVPEEAAFLLFYRSELTGPRFQLTQRALALYHLRTVAPPVPTLPFPFPLPPAPPMPLPWVPVRRNPPRPPILGRGSYIKDVSTIISNGEPASRFDIVLTGDGFAERDLPLFDARVAALRNVLAMRPFNALSDLINVHVVRAVSEQSGITNCPAAGLTKRTYYDVRGNWTNTGYAGFVGMPVPELVYQAGERIAPRHELELYLVIANCAIEGGSAFPALDIAFVTMYQDMTKFANFAAHEMAHVIAGVAEEYIGCEPPDSVATYANRVTEAEKQAGTVWWKALAAPNELLNGAFRAVHSFGQPFDPNHEPIVAPGLTGMLGLYWGCQDIDPTIPGPPNGLCDPYEDPRGQFFHRPEARCKMRKSFFEFCRVCRAMISANIVQSVP